VLGAFWGMIKICLAGLLAICGIHALAQPGIKDSIYSQKIGEERRLQIQLPADYKPGSGQKYPVLYLLDGEWNAELFQQAQAWLKQWEFNPPIIMVGVVNSYPNNQNQRFRDLTPTTAGRDGAGGGPKLLAFLKEELVPYINKKYPSNGSSVLWGHSLGGLFVLYAMFTEPGLFDSYIAADPSLWWDHGFLKKYAKEKMGSIKGTKSLFITGRTGAPYHGMGIDSLEMLLREIAPPNLQWKAVAYPDETHVSQQGKSAYDGLKYTFSPLLTDRIRVGPMGGIVVKGKPFTVTCDNVLCDKYIRYTTDGTVPTIGSAKMEVDNVITPKSDVRLSVKTFLVVDSMNKSFTGEFTVGSPLATVKMPEGAIKGGWNFTCYKTAAGGEVIKTGRIPSNVDLNQVDSNGFFCRISGLLKTEKMGYYVFIIAGEPGTKLYIGDRLLMEIPAGSDNGNFIVPLELGFYPVRLEYSHRKGGANIDFGYKLPDAVEGEGIPDSLMYYVP